MEFLERNSPPTQPRRVGDVEGNNSEASVDLLTSDESLHRLARLLVAIYRRLIHDNPQPATRALEDSGIESDSPVTNL